MQAKQIQHAVSPIGDGGVSNAPFDVISSGSHLHLVDCMVAYIHLPRSSFGLSGTVARSVILDRKIHLEKGHFKISVQFGRNRFSDTGHSSKVPLTSSLKRSLVSLSKAYRNSLIASVSLFDDTILVVLRFNKLLRQTFLLCRGKPFLRVT